MCAQQPPVRTHSDESLTKIAECIGYLSDTAFSIAFKRSTGLSPGRFRLDFREQRS
ncbi:AraC family transcriptional regulator [Paraburkholderia sediminicola]